MGIKLDENLIKYMKAKGHKDLVIYTQTSRGGCCGGTFLNVKVRFAEEGDEKLVEKGYATMETEVGLIYYQKDKLLIGKRPQLILNQFLNIVNIQAMDIGSVSQENLRGIPV